MDFNSLFQAITTWWQSLPFAAQYNIWLGSGIFLLIVACLVTYYCFRRALGHRKFGGAWLSARAYDALVQSLILEQKESNRVLNHQELLAVREYLHGSGFKPLHKGKYGGYTSG
jgi:hypothetical protein